MQLFSVDIYASFLAILQLPYEMLVLYKYSLCVCDLHCTGLKVSPARDTIINVTFSTRLHANRCWSQYYIFKPVEGIIRCVCLLPFGCWGVFADAFIYHFMYIGTSSNKHSLDCIALYSTGEYTLRSTLFCELIFFSLLSFPCAYCELSS